MQNAVVIIDSGVGGLSIVESLPKEFSLPVVYIADTDGFPYGTKAHTVLLAALEILVGHCVEKFATRRIVLACNTATLVGIAALRKQFPEITFIGTVPPIKMLEQYSTRTRFGLLASEATAFHNYAKSLHRSFSPQHSMLGIPATRLIAAIEKHAPQWDHPAVCHEIAALSENIRALNINALVHGCTHFFHSIPLFRRYLPELEHLDAVGGVVTRVIDLFQKEEEGASRAIDSAKRILYTTSDVDQDKWAAIATMFDFAWKGNMAHTPA